MYLPIDGIEHQAVRFVVHSSNHYTKDTLHVTQNSENYYLCDCPQARPTRAIANLPTSLFSKCPPLLLLSPYQESNRASGVLDPSTPRKFLDPHLPSQKANSNSK